MNKDKLKATQVFTPEWATNQMLDLMDQTSFGSPETYFLEPSCGDGQMLVVMVDRIFKELLKKYEGDHAREKALSETLFKFYAIEMDADLVVKARFRLREKIVSEINVEGFDVPYFLDCMIAQLLVDSIECRDFFEMFGDNGSTIGKKKKFIRKGKKE